MSPGSCPAAVSLWDLQLYWSKVSSPSSAAEWRSEEERDGKKQTLNLKQKVSD